MNLDRDLLTHTQFRLLFVLLGADQKYTQRHLASETGLSLGAVNASVRECAALGYLNDGHITEAGLKALEPYRVDNAVIMAAGLAERFVPISYEKPKGLLTVKGEVLIERQIRQLLEAGIGDIIVVVGYKKEYFFYLARKYGVRIVVNDEYATRNNNGTLWRVRDQLRNTYVCSSDNYFTENPFEPFVYGAYYASVYAEGPTQEWCIQTGSGGRIIDLNIGGRDSWTMLGHVYFDEAFSATFQEILADVYDRPETVDKLWEEIYLNNIENLHMVARKYPHDFIYEFDSLADLQGFDSGFIENVDSEIFDNIARILEVERSVIQNFDALKQGMTNLSCRFTVAEEEYVYRHPGLGTHEIVDRHAEQEGLLLAQELGLDSTLVHVDAKRGWKISRFIPGQRHLDFADKDQIRLAMQSARRLHRSGATLSRKFDFIDEAHRFESLLTGVELVEVPGYSTLREKVNRLKAYADADNYPLVPSHNDFFHLNFLVEKDGKVNLIDWEYSGMSDEASDFGSLVVGSQLSDEQTNLALEYYLQRSPTPAERRHYWAYVVFTGWAWYVWSLAKDSKGDDVGEVAFSYYQYAADNVDELLEQYEAAVASDARE